MSRTAKLEWIREALWLAFTAVFVTAVLMPIIGSIKAEYLYVNAVFLAFAVTYFRYTVFLNTVPYLKPIWTRVLLIIINIILFFQGLRLIQEFLFVIDNYTISTFLTIDKMFEFSEKSQDIFLYFRTEYVTASTTAMVLLVICTIRTAASLWTYSREFREGNLRKTT